MQVISSDYSCNVIISLLHTFTPHQARDKSLCVYPRCLAQYKCVQVSIVCTPVSSSPWTQSVILWMSTFSDSSKPAPDVLKERP